MEFETPIDAWYMWLGVAFATIAIASVALSLPTQPPPDATAVANTIDRVAGSTEVAGASYEHDAEEVRVDMSRLSMRNGGGTAHASITFGPITPVAAVSNTTKQAALFALLDGTPPSVALNRPQFAGLTEADLHGAVSEVRRNLWDQTPEWQPASGTLRIRKLELDGKVVVLVAV
ncbi:hypothetical protein ACFQJ7_07670 [Halovenus rubra]|uniref:Uncharacterized protein n=2 Tax=Halovenus rubra TaxID=869890 RepID=A0ACC7E207_9EURY|nr:hypothetical protein [Halovenus rubra]